MALTLPAGTTQWLEEYCPSGYTSTVGSKIWDTTDADARGFVLYSASNNADHYSTYTWMPCGSYFFTENTSTDTISDATNARIGTVTSGVFNDIALGGSSLTKITKTQASSLTDSSENAINLGSLRVPLASNGKSDDSKYSEVIDCSSVDLLNSAIAEFTITETSSTTGLWDQVLASAGQPVSGTTFSNTTSAEDANVTRIVGDQINVRFGGNGTQGKRSTSSGTVYDYGIGGDGSISIGPIRSVQSIDNTPYSGTSGFMQGTSFVWPGQDSETYSDYPKHISEIVNVGATFLTNGTTVDDSTEVAKGCFENLIYGHTFNFQRGINIAVGQNDGNDINLATGWSYSDSFWPGSTDESRPDQVTPQDSSGNAESGWKIPSHFDFSGLPSPSPPGGLEVWMQIINFLKSFATLQIPDVSFETIKNVGIVFGTGASFLVSPVLATVVLATAAAGGFGDTGLTDEIGGAFSGIVTDAWEDLGSYSFGPPTNGSQVAMITAADFLDCADPTTLTLNSGNDIQAAFLTGSKLNIERHVGTQASYTRGDSIDIWEDADARQWSREEISGDQIISREVLENSETYVQVAHQTEVNINGFGYNLSTVSGSYETSQDRQIDVGLDVAQTKVSLATDGFVGTVGRAAGSKIDASYAGSTIEIGIKGLEIKNTISGLAVKNENTPVDEETTIGAAKTTFYNGVIWDWGVHAIKTGVNSALAYIKAELLKAAAGLTRMYTRIMEMKQQLLAASVRGVRLLAAPFSVMMGAFTAGAHHSSHGQGGLTSGDQMKKQLIEDFSLSDIADHVDEDGDDARIPEAHQGVATDVRDSVSGRTG